MVLDKDKLLNDGYLTFNIKDLDESLYNDLYTNFDKNTELDSITRLRYDGTIRDGVSTYSIDDFFDDLKNECNLYVDSSINYDIINNKNIKLFLNLNAKYNSLVQAKNKLDNLNGIIKDQSWFFNQPHRNPNHKRVISQVYKQILMNLYSEYIGEAFYSTNEFGFDFTLYEKNDFIVSHNDGIDPNRLCVILIYLNDDYTEGYGGELVIEKTITLKPEFGQVAILDFTDNNVNHCVNVIKDESFKRFAFIKFFYKKDIN